MNFNVPYWLYGFVDDPEYDPVIKFDPLYSRYIPNPLSVDHKLWE